MTRLIPGQSKPSRRLQRTEAVVTVQGKLLTCKLLRPKSQIPPSTKRGIVSGFSAAARFRLLKLLATINWKRTGRSSFLTLTYPDWHSAPSPYELNKQRYLIVRHIEKYLCKKIPAIWRIEWKPRLTGKHVGTFMPHYHLMLFNVGFIPQEEILAKWQQTLGYEKYLEVWIEEMANEKQVGYYVAKYCAKVADSSYLDNDAYLNSVRGRNWGVHRKAILPVHEANEIVIPPGFELEALRQIASGRDPGILAEERSFTLLGQLAELGATVVGLGKTSGQRKG